MKIKILGTKGEIEPSLPYHTRQSGVLIDDSLMIDIGEKEFLDYNPSLILITHLHPDHAYFVRRGFEEKPATSAKIFAPEKPKKEFLQDTVALLEKRKEMKGFSITPIPTHHSLKVKSQGYLIQKGKHSIFYSGDLVWIDKKYHKHLEGVELVITEGSYIRKGGLVLRNDEGKIYGHNGIPDLIHLFKKFTDKIMFVHFGNWFFKDTQSARKKIHSLAKENEIELIVGYDGLELTF